MATPAFAAAISEHPVTAHAIGEAAGQVLERLGEGADLAAVFVTPGHAGALEDVSAVVRSILRPSVLVGCAAESVLANGREVEGSAAVVVWAGRVGPVAPVHLRLVRTPDGTGLTGWPAHPRFEPRSLLLFADPFSFPAEAFFKGIGEVQAGLPVIGGNASAARGPGGNRLVIDDRVVTSGAVGAILSQDASVVSVVSQGCRPIGSPYTVTRADGDAVIELGGQPALQRLEHLMGSGLAPGEVELVNQGLFLGVVVDERRLEYGPGDFLIRGVTGADRATGAIHVGERVEVGSTVQYHVRDAVSADEDLRASLTGRQAEGALVFTCNGRGTRLFDEPHHDAGVVAEVLDGAPAAGFFAAGEFGPVGGRNFVHGHTASVALFQRR
jgi:small ligand-binding sensory domain FIST